MKKLISVREGELIPEGAVFIECVITKIPTHVSKNYVGTDYGFFTDRDHFRYYQHYRTERHYIYEVYEA